MTELVVRDEGPGADQRPAGRGTDQSEAEGRAMTYLTGGDPADTLTDYFPTWIEHLADDVTIEGSVMDGVAHGVEAARTILLTIRGCYESQVFHFVGPIGDNGLVEDYAAQVHGEPIRAFVLVVRNAAGQIEHIVANYRPRTSVVALSRLVGEKLAGTPYAKHFDVATT
jgi:hypothetical protein